MPRKKVVRKERCVFEKVPGSDIWWIRYKVEGVEPREKVGRLETRLICTVSGARMRCGARRCPPT
jgi:hypothetical protein